ncbi:MAG: DUF3267 domain-containing protein [Anaerolineales bacterium]|nr:DUF3267 domain-containing protein [Anaerolineales bacterium]
MRFHYGAVPENNDFSPEIGGWRGIWEPGPILIQILAIPVAVGLVMIWMLLLVLSLYSTNPASPLAQIFFPGRMFGEILLFFLLIIPLHELVHALMTPGAGSSPHTVIGFWPSRLLFYAHYEEEMPRNRFLLVFVMPYLVFGILPIALLALLPALASHLAALSFVGSILACGDILGAGLILFQIPARAVIRNKGWKTYWRPVP